MRLSAVLLLCVFVLPGCGDGGKAKREKDRAALVSVMESSRQLRDVKNETVTLLRRQIAAGKESVRLKLKSYELMVGSIRDKQERDKRNDEFDKEIADTLQRVSQLEFDLGKKEEELKQEDDQIAEYVSRLAEMDKSH